METFHEKFVAPKCRIMLWGAYLRPIYTGLFEFSFGHSASDSEKHET
jgi:hypothetical protein